MPRHGDVVKLTGTTGAVTRSYDYDAFGNQKNADALDVNPFRYCGEYWDAETKTYYLRARYYDPSTGRFLAEDTHWNPGNSIYGEKRIEWSQYQDSLKLNFYSYAPDVFVIMQSGNLYVYCINNPLQWQDSNGLFIAEIAEFIVRIFVSAANSVTIEIEYGAGIGGSYTIMGIEGEGKFTVNGTSSFSLNGIEHSEWTTTFGASVGPQGAGDGFGVFVIVPADASKSRAEVGMYAPNRSVVVTPENDVEVSFGGSIYFGFGGGFKVSFNASEFTRQVLGDI